MQKRVVRDQWQGFPAAANDACSEGRSRVLIAVAGEGVVLDMHILTQETEEAEWSSSCHAGRMCVS